jgi:hypothetical protein
VRVTYEPCPRCRSRGKDSRGDNLVCYPDGGKHCFSCGYHVFASVLSVFKNLKEKEVNDTKVLPIDFSREVPTEAWKWLLQYGLSYSYWQPYVGYSSSYGRLVIQARDIPNGSTRFSIGRLIDKTKEGRKWFVWGDCHSSAESFGRPGAFTVLVEDIISAHKVGQVAESLCLFGTEIHKAHTYFLRDNSNRPIILWLDKDQEGYVSKKALRIQMLTNRPVIILHTHKDPKELTFNEIKEQLNAIY